MECQSFWASALHLLLQDQPCISRKVMVLSLTSCNSLERVLDSPSSLVMIVQLTFSPSPQEKEVVEDPTKLKEVVLSKLGRVSDKMKQVFERSEVGNMVYTPLTYRRPWELLWGNISKTNV